MFEPGILAALRRTTILDRPHKSTSARTGTSLSSMPSMVSSSCPCASQSLFLSLWTCSYPSLVSCFFLRSYSSSVIWQVCRLQELQAGRVAAGWQAGGGQAGGPAGRARSWGSRSFRMILIRFRFSSGGKSAAAAPRDGDDGAVAERDGRREAGLRTGKRALVRRKRLRGRWQSNDALTRNIIPS